MGSSCFQGGLSEWDDELGMVELGMDFNDGD